MKAYSLDLRERIVRACEQECLTRREAAEDFAVSPAFVQKLLQQLQDEGSIAPKKGGRGPAPKLDAKQAQRLRRFVQDHPDATLQELCTQLKEGGGPSISSATMCRALQDLQLPLKKKIPATGGAGHTSGAEVASSVVAESPEDRCRTPGFRR